MHIRSMAVLACVLALGSGHAHAAFSQRTTTVNGHAYRYQVYMPDGKTRAHPPVVLFLHGSGERGNDNQKQMSQGLPPWLVKHPGFEGVVVIPQAAEHTLWRGESADAAMKALEDTIKAVDGDRKRIYLTGLSMGGYGAWELLVQYPTTFAAAAVICGGIQPQGVDALMQVYDVREEANAFSWVASHMGPTPVWIFHGSADGSVPVEQSRKMHEALEAIHHEVRYTEYPGVGHGSWIPAYDEPGLWPWMFSHRLGDAHKPG
jgi:predicted ribosomally synthesized peptide with SipW-like signal peptide